MPETSDYILVLGIAYNLSKLAGDPALRAELLEKTRRRRAVRQYKHLIHALAEYDAKGGQAEPLVLRRLEDGPERSGRQELARGKSKPGHWGMKEFQAAKRREEKELAELAGKNS